MMPLLQTYSPGHGSSHSLGQCDVELARPEVPIFTAENRLPKKRKGKVVPGCHGLYIRNYITIIYNYNIIIYNNIIKIDL